MLDRVSPKKPAPKSAEAIRAQRARDRRKDGRLVERIEFDRALVDALVDAHRLGEWEDEDRPAIVAAVLKLLGHWTLAVTRDGGDPVPRDTDSAGCKTR